MPDLFEEESKPELITANPNFITIDLNLPNHYNELCKADEVLDKLKKRFEIIKMQKAIDGKFHTALYEEIIKVLDYVGKLSIPAFKIEDELEKLYVLQYSHAPNLAKQLWLEHYASIHHPYSLIKNRCYRLLDDLDKEYQVVWKSNPPNWNI